MEAVVAEVAGMLPADILREVQGIGNGCRELRGRCGSGGARQADLHADFAESESCQHSGIVELTAGYLGVDRDRDADRQFGYGGTQTLGIEGLHAVKGMPEGFRVERGEFKTVHAVLLEAWISRM